MQDKTVILILVAVFACWSYWADQETKRKDAKEKCDRSISCQNEIASIQSIGSAIPIRSSLGGAMYYRGNRCLDDCSGHMAGYAWAERNFIKDERMCGGYSRSFYEGCVSFARYEGRASFDGIAFDPTRDPMHTRE